MNEYRKYDVAVSELNGSKKFHITNNYFDKSDYAFYKNGTLSSYSDNAADFIRRCFRGVEDILNKAEPGRWYAIYTNGIHGEAIKYERVPGINKVYTSPQHKDTVYAKAKAPVLDSMDYQDLRQALGKIAKLNTAFHLENDLGVSIEQMERAAKINDHTDKTLIWVSYPSGIDCYPEREVFQKDTRGYHGVLYHANNAGDEIKLAYAVDVTNIVNGRVYGRSPEQAPRTEQPGQTELYYGA